MTLEEQWKNDVNQFGELAYLMWESSLTDDKRQRFSDIFPTENLTVVTNMLEPDVFILRRKQSAALPFDLAAARVGDKVQALRINPEEWIDCTPLLHERIYTGRCTGNESIPTKEFGWYDQKFLRMKHPRRVAMDYSQLEG